MVKKSARAVGEAVEAYFRRCEAAERFPSAAGLALALGFPSRQALERRARLGPDGKPADRTAEVLLRAKSRIEDETVQAALRRDTAAGARFLLQNGFGYTDKQELGLPAGSITVTITDDGA